MIIGQEREKKTWQQMVYKDFSYWPRLFLLLLLWVDWRRRIVWGLPRWFMINPTEKQRGAGGIAILISPIAEQYKEWRVPCISTVKLSAQIDASPLELSIYRDRETLLHSTWLVRDCERTCWCWLTQKGNFQRSHVHGFLRKLIWFSCYVKCFFRLLCMSRLVCNQVYILNKEGAES